MSDDNDIRHGRHCVFKMHVHLVFVAKYRRRVFDGDAINRLRTIFAKTCADFEAQLIDEQPQRRIQSSAAQGAARHPETLLEGRAVVAVLLRLILWRCADFHRAAIHRTAADTTLKTKDKDGYAVRAILPLPCTPG